MKAEFLPIICTAAVTAAAALFMGITNVSAQGASDSFDTELTSFEQSLMSDVCIHGNDEEGSENSDGWCRIELDECSVGDNNGYSLYSGCFTTNKSVINSCLFNEPDSFEFLIGDEAAMTAKRGFEGNYKSVHVVNTYLENGELVYRGSSAAGTDACLTVPVNYSGSGNLVESKYFFCLHDDGKDSMYRDVAVVHIVDKEHPDFELYAVD